MKLSVITVYYGNKDFENTLECLNDVAKLSDYESIVVNNGSKEWNNQWEKIYNNVKFVRLSENKGFSKANNIAVRKYSRGEYILFLNPDAFISREDIEKLIDCHEKNECSVSGPKILYPDGKIQYSCRTFPSLKNVFFSRRSLIKRIFPNNKITKTVLNMDMDYNSFNLVDWVVGAAILIKRDLFLEFNGFDEDFFLFLEDTDLQYRIKDRNGKICFCPESVVIHEFGTTMKRFRFRARYYHHVSMYKYFIKRGYDSIFFKVILYIGAVLHFVFENIVDSLTRWRKI